MGLSLEPSIPCFVMKIYFCTMFFVSSFVLLLSCTQKGEGEFGMVTSLQAADFWREPKGRAASSSCLCPTGEMRIFPGACPKTGSFGSWINWVHLIKQLLGFFLCFGIAD